MLHQALQDGDLLLEHLRCVPPHILDDGPHSLVIRRERQPFELHESHLGLRHFPHSTHRGAVDQIICSQAHFAKLGQGQRVDEVGVHLHGPGHNFGHVLFVHHGLNEEVTHGHHGHVDLPLKPMPEHSRVSHVEAYVGSAHTNEHAPEDPLTISPRV